MKHMREEVLKFEKGVLSGVLLTFAEFNTFLGCVGSIIRISLAAPWGTGIVCEAAHVMSYDIENTR